MKFSIRDLFLVTLIVAIAVLVLGWANEWFAHSVTRQTLESLKFDAGAKGCKVTTTTDYLGPFTVQVQAKIELPTSQAPAPNPPKP